MRIPSPANRRLLVLSRLMNRRLFLEYDSRTVRLSYTAAAGSEGSPEITENYVKIGDVKRLLVPPNKPEFIPIMYGLKNLDQDTLHHLRWMIQKDQLSQDIFLVGRPGPLKRRLAMKFLEVTQRELEFVSLSRDTTESDLKQRREIESASARYIDQSAVRAAVEGRVLVLDGIEKAERNVLPVLNNLLENREMHLEDGRFLIPSHRYDKLLKEFGADKLDAWRLVRVSEDFRVIALGLPVPGYQGNPLDPPLRSRFQARDVTPPPYQDNINGLIAIYPDIKYKLTQLMSCAYGLISPESSALGLPDFPVDNLPAAAALLAKFPWLTARDVLGRLYPCGSMLPKEGTKSVDGICKTFYVGDFTSGSRIESVRPSNESIANVTFAYENQNNTVETPYGGGPSAELSGYIPTEYQENFLAELAQSHVVSDMCMIGPAGCGKSIAAHKLATSFGYTVEPIIMYQDMTSRDLLQQRTTLDNGDTVWRNSPLVTAALEGKMAVLDGLHRVHPSTLGVLHRLVHDREVQLYDGSRLMRYDRYDALAEIVGQDNLKESKIFRIHPSFRIVALAEPNGHDGKKWLNPELLSLFLYHEMRPLSISEEIQIINSLYGKLSANVKQILEFSHSLRESSDITLQSLAGSLSTRQLLRIAKRSARYCDQDPYNVIQRACLAKFLPPLAKQTLEMVLSRAGIRKSDVAIQDDKNKIIVDEDTVTIGKTSTKRFDAKNTSKVPDILFYDVPQHVTLLERLMQDFLLGEHLLLVGNQGVGKNKLADRLLQLLNRPREYIQLHRDTTVQTLTLQPTVIDGVVSYEDSPLVTAIKTGHILVVDEADKAPTHVTCILKTLVESGEMILSDGRRIVQHSDPRASGSDDSVIPIHPDFRMIVLANRPGFPFLGNDFFGALGDLFSCHAVDNPSAESEIALLRNYGPDVPLEIIEKLVAAFGELRIMADQGLVAYPYSTREIVNIVKHLQVFPDDTLSDAVGNVFDFDRYSHDVRETLLEVLTHHKIPVAITAEDRFKQRKPIQMTVKRDSHLGMSGPKHGKVDENNDPHVGGNTWAGGTGGRDTAGLGGKGGPYRLDAGHDVHQISDEEKAAVPEHIRRAAREMGMKAFKEKLKEIKMSEYDASLYEQFSSAVTKQVQALRVILSSLQAKSKERQWTRHQTSGELDDTKLIEGLTGEKNIYRRRAEKEPEVGAPQLKPKRLKIVVDVSGSMYRFNGYDGRLDRELEAVVMVMEAFQGHEARFQYDIVGHSGESYSITFVEKNNPPANNKHRLEILKTMHAHAQFCMSGDNTLDATEDAVISLAKEDCDEAFVVVLSDANLSRYGIPPKELGFCLTREPQVEGYAIFIGSLGNEAARITSALPAGRSFVCLDLKTLPQILQTIFTSSMLKSR